MPTIVRTALATHGEPLDGSTRRTYETALGQDFSRVRVHSGPLASEASEALTAAAFTVGEHIVFGTNRYRPNTVKGRELISHELGHVVDQQQGPLRIQRQEGDWVGQAEPPPPGRSLSEDQIIAIETSTIAEKLKSFREVKVYVKGPAEMRLAKPPGFREDLPGAPGLNFDLPHYPLKEVRVHAAYFINRPSSQTAFHSGNTFKKIVRALKTKTLIETGIPPSRYSLGRAVEMGKSTPDDVRAFVEEALEQGAIKAYAHATAPFKGQFPAGKTELWDLLDKALHDVIQKWVMDKGVGVDCSGFVLQAAIAVREKIQAAYMERDLPFPDQYKAGISHEERKAANFASGTPRARPTDIKLGDAWVIGTHHVRIVASTPFEVDGQIQFDADESYGDSSHTTVGPILHTWRTHSTTAFNTMRRLKDGRDPAKKAEYENIPQGSHGFYAIS